MERFCFKKREDEREGIEGSNKFYFMKMIPSPKKHENHYSRLCI